MDNATQSNGSKIIIATIIVIALGLVGYGFYRSQIDRSSNETAPDITIPVVPPEEEYAEIINAKHQYRGGKHIYAGELDLPTPCHLLQSDVIRDPSNPSIIEIEFTSVYEGTDACIQVITPRPFKVTFDAPKEIGLKVRYNGKPIRLNIFEVPESENLDLFDINVKG